jgi:3D (Asp-Asp-Asp) domain-containing protein
MDNRIAFWRFPAIQHRLNTLALAILLFNLTNPGLASAEVSEPRPLVDATLATTPTSRFYSAPVCPRTIRGTITAYTSTPDQTDGNPFVTASGKRVHDGIIAANGLPFGTVIKIPSLFGDKRFVVQDRMNARYEFGHFDVWLETTRKEALKFGVKHVTVEIYYPDQQLAFK